MNKQNVACLGRITLDSVKRTLAIKAAHYSHLAALDCSYLRDARIFSELNKQVHESPSVANRYIAHLRSQPIGFPVWWEETRPFEEL